MSLRIVEVRPASDARLARMGCFEVFEGDGVRPTFPSRELAVSYAVQRARYAHCEIQVLDDARNIVETIGKEEAQPVV